MLRATLVVGLFACGVGGEQFSAEDGGAMRRALQAGAAMKDGGPPGQPSASSLGWLLGHTWGAIIEAKGFLEDGADLERRTSAFAAAPRAVSSLRVL